MRFAAAQSGGPTCAMNASLSGICEAVSRQGHEILGIRNGIEGLLSERFADLNEMARDPDQRALLKHTPGAALGSCRFRLPEGEEDIYREILRVLRVHSIDALLYTGGNDSMDTVAKLSAWLRENGVPIPVIGIPKTIDNDLVGTDHTPGFGSAVRYLAVTLSEIALDSSVYRAPSVTVCEIMGRDAGWLTASACVPRALGSRYPQLIYLPEADFTLEGFLGDVERALRQDRCVLCAVSEGVRIPQARDFRSGANDAFGHAYLSGVGKFLEGAVREKLGCKVRSVELNIMQRCSGHLASETDLDEAEECGRRAVDLALSGRGGEMVVMRRLEPYEIVYESMPAADAANQIRPFPARWITEEGNQIREEAAAYFLPLIGGALPSYFHLPE